MTGVGTAGVAIIGLSDVGKEGWAIIGLVVGALLGLIPRYFDARSDRRRERLEQEARLRSMLAGVLMKCVHSTNQFLDQWTTYRLERPLTEQGEDPGEDLRNVTKLAFEMKTAWMESLVSFGDPVDGKESSDPRRMVIRDMLRDVEKTYDHYNDGDATTDRVIDQLGEVARISRQKLEDLIELGA